MKKYTVITRIRAARTRIQNSHKSAQKALLTIYENQTSDERSYGATAYKNKVGFTGLDAPFLTSLARQLLDRGRLTDKQNRALQKTMPKYAKQIVQIKRGVLAGRI